MRDFRERAYDLAIFIPAMLLLGAGLVMVFSASQMQALSDFGDMFYYIKRQVVWVILGVSVMYVAMKLRLDNARKLAVPLFVAALASLAAVLAVGKTVGGAKRWIDIGIGTLQPSEFAKPLMVFVLAWYYDFIEKQGKSDFLYTVAVPMVFAVSAAGLVLLEPDFSTAGLFVVLALAIVFTSTKYKASLLVLGAPAVIGAFAWAVQEPYRWRRITGFLNPWSDARSSGYQIVQTLYALGSGGIKGLGLGLSRQKMYYIPEQHTDFIFAVVGEELGLIGTTSFAALYLIIAIRGLRIANQTEDTFKSTLAYGLSMWIALQAFINMGVVANLLPVTGMTLPLVSAGGSSMLPTMAAVGLLLNISRDAAYRR
ncbi:MAG TPA: putative lipid II flippase FtsW [Bacillota bacterium]|nr:putative lipid II flippase FtsW [Bacillota bacterium]